MNFKELKEYFDNVSGYGVLATADAQGQVNQAVFARPHMMEDDTVAFIMPHRRTHHNLEQNPQAAYLFREEAPGWKGKRLYITKLREEKETELLYSLRRKSYPPEMEKKEGPRFLVFFRVDKVLPLIGTGEKAD